MLASSGMCVPAGMLSDCRDKVGKLFLLLCGTASLSLPDSSSNAELLSASLPVSRKLRFFGLCPRVREDDRDRIGAADDSSRAVTLRTGVSSDVSALAGGAEP